MAFSPWWWLFAALVGLGHYGAYLANEKRNVIMMENQINRGFRVISTVERPVIDWSYTA